MSNIVIVDYGAGNLMSIKNMLRKAGHLDVVISNQNNIISNADKLILPGVGHFDYGMKKLKESGLIPILNHQVMQQQTPILGICLGAQLMTEGSEEGKENGLGWVNGKTVAFDKNKLAKHHKIPHMGWNEVHVKKQTKLLINKPEASRFYFVHSYHFHMYHQEDVWLTTHYAYEFCAAFHRKNIYACQFHPEKSHKFGLELMKNFVALKDDEN
jgi:glutamine amidotransferase